MLQRDAAIVMGSEPMDLLRVRERNVCAVIVDPPARPSWEAELAGAVERAEFVVARAQIVVPRFESLAVALEPRLPPVGLRFETRLALIDDLVDLAALLSDLADCRALMVRLFTERPSENCGYHVDTVAPRCPPFGLLKVYNGEGTRYLDPADVLCMREFYRYVARRERLVRELGSAGALERERGADCEREAIGQLDADLPFVRRGGSVRRIEAGSIVAFRHLDAGEHGMDAATGRAWIHCSPMSGSPRLVVNMTPLDGTGGRFTRPSRVRTSPQR